MPRSAVTGVFTRVSNSFSQPVVGTLIDPVDADAYFDDLDVGLNPPNLAGSTNIINGLTLGKSGSIVGTLGFFNATTGSITLSPPTGALGSAVLTLPDATDTLVGKATTDILTNKTYDTAGTGNSFLINGLAVTANTGTGAVARADSPVFTTQITTPLVVGGSAAGSSAIIRATSNVAPSGEVVKLEAHTINLVGLAGTATTINLGAAGSSSAFLTMAGASSGAVTVQASAVASGTLTLPSATDTLVGKATTDILTNKSISGATNTLTNVPISTAVSGLGTGVATALGVATNASGGAIVPVTAGTTGQVLTGVTAAAPTFQAAGFRLLNTLTASNSATLVDTTSLTAAYDTYEIVFENLVPATNAVQLLLRVSQDGGGTYKATGYLDASTATTEVRITGSTSADNTAGGGLSGRCLVSGISQTDRKKQFSGNFAARVGGVANAGFIAGWYNTDNGAINALQFLASSGNLSTGIIRIYGVRSS